MSAALRQGPHAPEQFERPRPTPIVPAPPDAPTIDSSTLRWFCPAGYAYTNHWTYYGSAGNVLGYVARYDHPVDPAANRKQFWPLVYCQRSDGRSEWCARQFPAPRPLYGLDRLAARPEARVLVAEGEKAADAAQHRFPDCVAITSPGGCKSARSADWSVLGGRDVTIWPDADESGEAYAEDVVEMATEAGAQSVRVVDVAEFPAKWDLAEQLPPGVSGGDLARLLAEAQPAHTDAGEDAEGFEPPSIDPEQPQKPRLLVEASDPDRTVADLRDILANAEVLYDRGVPVRLAIDQIEGGTVAQVMTPDALVLTAHMLCRPYMLKDKGGDLVKANTRLPRNIAVMYLDWRGEWQLPLLNGIASAPLLEDDGTIHGSEGYDPATGIWRENVPDLSAIIPLKPTRANAAAALRRIRETFCTFCFADAETVANKAGIAVVDIDQPPGKDESAFLAALLTGVCRPSLHLAPGILFRASPISGSGAGKGLLARYVSIIAFGREPHAVTGGATADELEKRVAAELIGGSPVLFLDNLNNTALKSKLLASAITERPAQVRVLGRSQMVPLNPSALVILTGNGLTLSEDLTRRFVIVEFDAHVEDPEARSFSIDIQQEVRSRRVELLAAALTIWRWGRIDGEIKPGKPMGSFEQWGRWVRDPLLTLGCQDPADRVKEAKERDARRQNTAEVFTLWWERHRDQPLAASGLDEGLIRLLDPQGRGRQFVSSQLVNLTGTRIAGLVLTRQAPPGKWGSATYSMKLTGGEDEHRGHRGHRSSDGETWPYAPYAPYAQKNLAEKKNRPTDGAPTESASHQREAGREEHRDHRGDGGENGDSSPDAPDAPYANEVRTETTEGQPRGSPTGNGRREPEREVELRPDPPLQEEVPRSAVARREATSSSADQENYDDLEIPSFLKRAVGDGLTEGEVAAEPDLPPQEEERV
jgi:hypothetical protein